MGVKEEFRPLDERTREILNLIIRSHISSGEPVGSRTLAKALNWTLSPATIRNIMSDLEDAGYLAQPHTSAGRVPSEKGYRFYVNSLGEGKLSRSDERYISRMLAESDSPEDVMSRTSVVLSTISKNVGIVVAPPMAANVLKHIEFVDLTDGKILVIFVSTSGLLQRKLIRVSERYLQEDLDKAGRYLVEKFSGKTLTEIRNELLRMMQAERSLFDRLLALLQTWRESLDQEPIAVDSVYLQGTANIISQPEFADVERMRMLFQMFEEKGRLVKILNECISSNPPEGVRIVIGSELGVADMRGFTLITTSYASADHTTGFLGIIGPTRMEYERGISIVGYLGRLVGEMINA
jgi:heat-inducible transcriptional repressor